MEEIIIKESDAIIVRERGATKHDVNLEIVKKPKERNKNNIGIKIEKIDDFYFIENYQDLKNDFYFGTGIILFAFILFFWLGQSIRGILVVLIPIILFGIYTFFKGVIFNNTKVIMDRQRGLFSYPAFFSNKQIVTKFENVVFLIVYVGKMAIPTLKSPQRRKFFNFTFVTIDVLDFLSFYVWYMDKNRPLPPGDAFDEFRERDFQRRKSEGFPSPLYPSFVPTPEATPEQQQERDKYWEERFTTDENGETLRHFWERDRSLKVKSTQNN